MLIYIGADHRGFQLKESIKKHLTDSGYTVLDKGNTVHDEADNYPQFAKAVAGEIQSDPAGRRGVLVCGSGAGMCIVANKFPGIRASLTASPDQAGAVKEQDDVNVLCFASDFTDEDAAKKILAVWLQTPFSAEPRYRDRLEQIRQIEIDLGLWK
jgi:ribose 5-phosphate isomerase B